MISYLKGKLVDKTPTRLILDVNGVGKRYRTDIMENCGEDGTKTVTGSCDLPVESTSDPITGGSSEVQTGSQGGMEGVTGAAITDVGEGSSSIYWLIALGIIILVAGGVLYTREAKKK